ncbi:hypothetical protein BCV72DRAFT_77798 [Rhizopus microsporus var. microsporus]|uniref:Uncharacterized protein n=1 Tax=Rhizopus microsporus var. microsporus TaxID=86635 RepID=A0A1X0RI91_RHIZD|nr:hypothetical protein BCV72DRAFT_77798 [Rhizopus microsporus var. microsporus]
MVDITEYHINQVRSVLYIIGYDMDLPMPTITIIKHTHKSCMIMVDTEEIGWIITSFYVFFFFNDTKYKLKWI